MPALSRCIGSTLIILSLGGIVNISASQTPADYPAAPWLKGYANTVSGEAIGYHSPYPEVASALLVRATDGTMSCAWDTEAVPAAFDGETATFVWLSGLATQKGAHEFTLDLDGRRLLVFRSAKDAREKNWDVPGRDGARLSFRTTMVDQFQELFGFMFLELPKALLTPGRPVRLAVTGANAGSQDWFMVFPFRLEPWIRAAAEQALIRKDDGLRQLVQVEISHLAPPGKAIVSTPGGAAREVQLTTGYNAVDVSVVAVTKETDVEIRIDIAGRPPQRLTVRLGPVARREFWILPHSHTDIGYSDPQAVVEKKHWAYFEQAIALSRRTADYPAGARFKWNTEVLWAVESYLAQAPPEKKAAFFTAVRRGWIGLQATAANVLTGLCHPEELFHLTDFARRLTREEGLPITSAMITDIPGATWSVVPALAQSGVKYFSSGPNYMPRLPDGGDRIGGALKAWGDKPFYWIGPSGQDRILFWMAGRGYSWFHGLNRGGLDVGRTRPVLDYCRELAEANYPYDMVQVRYTIGGDNGPPDPDLADSVRTWNEVFESPRLRIATAAEMFEEFERRHGSEIPSVQGDFSPYWEDGAASTAREQAMNRAGANRLLSAEALWAMVDPSRLPQSDFTEAWRQVVLWDEHTWGASDSVSRPDGENARSQWDYKKAFAVESDRRSRKLLDEAVSAWTGAGTGRARSYGNAVDIINPTAWTRTEVVSIPRELSAVGDLVRDEKGAAVPSQRLASGDLAVLATAVPAFGARRFILQKGAPAARSAVTVSDNTLENSVLKATVDPVSGALSSLFWKELGGVELVDMDGGKGLNEYFYVPGRDPRQARGASNVRISVGEAGPLVASLVIESGAPGARSLRRAIRLAAGSARLEIWNTIDKEKIRTKESVHFSFPFRVPDGVARFDLGWGFMRPGLDQIAGACKDFFCPQNSVDISNRKFGVTWASLDVPLAELGAMTDERPVEKGVRGWRESLPPSTRLYAYVMNNYWHTNYKADQEGPVEIRFVVRPHPGDSAAAAVRFGMESSRPLLVSPAAAAGIPWPGAGLEAFPSDVLITSLKPSQDGKALIARVYNASERPEEARLAGRFASNAVVYRSSPFEDAGEALAGPLGLMPKETATLRIEIR